MGLRSGARGARGARYAVPVRGRRPRPSARPDPARASRGVESARTRASTGPTMVRSGGFTRLGSIARVT